MVSPTTCARTPPPPDFDKAAAERALMPPPPPDPARAFARRRARRCVLMHSPRFESMCALLRANGDRDRLLYPLLRACGVLRSLTVVEPRRASAGHLLKFHTREYVEMLAGCSHAVAVQRACAQRATAEDGDGADKTTDRGSALATAAALLDPKRLERYGLVDDCEVFEGLFEHCAAVAGASLHAASLLVRREADLAINWGGGRHHARRAEAAGFCYVNDVVLATQHLLKGFRRVLVVDTDAHHCDGVEEVWRSIDRSILLRDLSHLSLSLSLSLLLLAKSPLREAMSSSSSSSSSSSFVRTGVLLLRTRLRALVPQAPVRLLPWQRRAR